MSIVAIIYYVPPLNIYYYHYPSKDFLNGVHVPHNMETNLLLLLLLL